MAKSRSTVRFRSRPWSPAYERADVADSFVDPEMRRAVPRQRSMTSRESDTLARVPGLGADGVVARSAEDASSRPGRASPNLRRSPQTSYMGQKTFERINGCLHRCCLRVGRRALCRNRTHATTRRSRGTIRWVTCRRAPCGREWPSREEFGTTIRRIAASSPWNVTYVADLVCRRLDDLDEQTVQRPGIRSLILHPGRWRFALRRAVDGAESGSGLPAARLLEGIGDRSDIARLRGFAKRQRKLRGASGFGRQLSRQLADRVMVEDQGRVAILIGDTRDFRL